LGTFCSFDRQLGRAHAFATKKKSMNTSHPPEVIPAKASPATEPSIFGDEKSANPVCIVFNPFRL
jgi:hypothetical protein